MKDCGIVKDLLPLVAEDMASNETKAFVAAHIETCEACKKELKALKSPVETDPAAPLKSVRKSVKRHGWLIAGLIACLVAALLIGAVARLTKPIPIHSVEEAFADVSVTPEVHQQHDELVLYYTHAMTVHVKTETVDGEMFVYAYTTLWNQLFPERNTWGGSGIPLYENIKAVYFEPMDNTEHVLLYARDGYMPEAGFALPRLVMNYYFAIALVATVVLFIPWLVLLLKKKKARRIFDIMLLIPTCGTVAFLFAGFPATTISPLRDLIFVCIIALLLLGTGLCARKLLRKE